uniref:leucine-rich repeat-containing G-protein coupled receptor 5-like n=1 Tax=Scatophagus argus TaxID=75038 RepID=UPI001ED7EC64|nr:leucine-rich repeat-containing G-protein coupled receptor 5-like [Scatophagus argus]
MKLLLLLLLTWLGTPEGGGDCPAVCRCEGVHRLQRVDCVNVGLRSVPSGLSGFTSSLRLDANFISRLPASSFKGLTSLRHLRLDDNDLTKVPVLALSRLTELQALTLAVNNISYVPDRAFASLRRLLVLFLHDNRIQTLGRKSFDGLHNLETLDLSFNRIKRLPAAIRRLRNLRELNLQNNCISVVPENAFTGNPSIETIHIQNNPVHTVDYASLQLLPDLRTLRLSPSGLQSLTRLKELSVSHQHSTSELRFACCRVSLQGDAVDSPSTSCLDSSLWLLQVSVSFLLLVSVVSLLLSSQRLLVLLCWLRVLAALSGCSTISTHADPGSGLLLLCLSSEVFVMMVVVLESRAWTKSCAQISCSLGCSFTLTVCLLIAMQKISLCSASFLLTHSALMLLNTSCFLAMTHVIRRCPQEEMTSNRRGRHAA